MNNNLEYVEHVVCLFGSSKFVIIVVAVTSLVSRLTGEDVL